ncbi:hypothetical protein ABIE09_001823 [Lysobacter enzymogenes]|uniref:hypothetical protein n=1 Tax=Lysobacter enzymogenes TaxID=69 RepID=UPI00339A7431
MWHGRSSEQPVGRRVANRNHRFGRLASCEEGDRRLHGSWRGIRQRKGENLATKEDFDQLRDQLRKNTETTEQIKSAIGREDWLDREWRTIRARNLEQIASNSQKTLILVYQAAVAWRSGQVANDPDPSAAIALQTHQSLYFPELSLEVSAFLSSLHDLRDDAFEFYMMNVRTRADAGVIEQRRLETQQDFDRLVKASESWRRELHIRLSQVAADVYGRTWAPPEN